MKDRIKALIARAKYREAIMLLPDTNDRTILLSRLSKVEQKEAQYPESPYFIGREYRELAISALSICDAAEAVKSSLSAISNAAFRVRFY